MSRSVLPFNGMGSLNNDRISNVSVTSIDLMASNIYALCKQPNESAALLA